MMLGVIAWVLSTAAMVGGGIALGLFPKEHPQTYAASMLCVFAGMGVGGEVNGWASRRFPGAWFNL